MFFFFLRIFLRPGIMFVSLFVCMFVCLSHFLSGAVGGRGYLLSGAVFVRNLRTQALINAI
jgi:hypothetical protein